jgi:plasmid stabilization system protein ParE
MKYKVHMSARAEVDIDEALARLSRKGVSTATAGSWHERLVAAIATLERQPQRCAVAPESEDLEIELRELHFGHQPNVYRIFFVVEPGLVSVVHIRHAARDTLRREDLS